MNQEAENSSLPEPPARRGRKRSLNLLGWGIFIAALVAAGIAWWALDPGFRSALQGPMIASQSSEDDFGKRVRTYLLAHPEVIVEAMHGLQARQQAEEENEAKTTLKARADEIFQDPASPIGGNPAGDATLVEFFDYNCPYCRQMAPLMDQAVAEDPKLKIIYKEFPILGPGSVFAAKAALAANRQGMYDPFHKALFESKSRVDEAVVLKTAARVGLDVERLKKDTADPAIQAALDSNLALAQALRINGTPGFVIGNQILRGATDLATLKTLIAEARNPQPQSAPTRN